MSEQVTIYALFDEAGAVHYVGQTRRPEQRRRDHQKVWPDWTLRVLFVVESAATSHTAEGGGLLMHLHFADAVALAGRIWHAGYPVEAIACREDGRYVGWYVLFLGGRFDARVYRVNSVAEWERWLASGGQQQRGHPPIAWSAYRRRRPCLCGDDPG